MNKLIGKTKQLIFAKQTSMLSSSILLAAMILVARVFGFIRYRTFTGFFEAEQLDIFFAAFRIPDLIFEILITGALTTSFIPFFIRYDKDKEKQSVIVSSIINIIFVSLTILVLILLLFLPMIVNVITPGFSKEKTDMVIYFSYILLIAQLPLLVIGNVLTGISQGRKMFLLPAIAPIVYNLAIIVTTLFFSSSTHLLAPVMGVVIGAFLFCIVQIPSLYYSEFSYRFIIKKSDELWEFFKITIPRIFTVIVAQIDATVDLTLATLLGPGSYTVFYFAQHLQLLPVSVIGMAFGQASLPYLTEMYRENNESEFKKLIVDSLLTLLFLTIPMAGFYMIARTPLVRLFFGADKFDWNATNQTAVTVSYFALSVPFHSIYYFLTRCFYAIFDSRTPFYLSIVSVLVNAALSVYFILVLHMPIWSLGISFSISMALNVILLLIILYKKMNGYDVHMMILETAKIVSATFISAYSTYKLKQLLDGLIFDTSRTINVFLLMMTVGLFYGIVYIVLAWLFNVREMYLITRMLLKVKEYQRKIIELYTGTQ